MNEHTRGRQHHANGTQCRVYDRGQVGLPAIQVRNIPEVFFDQFVPRACVRVRHYNP